MEKAIESKTGINPQLGTKTEHAHTDSLLFDYLTRNLSISVDGQKRKMRWIGKEADFDAVWMYLEVESVQYIHQIAIRNTMLYEVFYDQSHIIKVNYDNEKEAGVVNRNKDRIEFRF
jgi:hypothetical protein